MELNTLLELFCSFSPLKIDFCGLSIEKSVQYGVFNGLDTVYWGFLGVGTTFDIFQNIILIPYLEYGVLSPLDMAYCSLIFCGLEYFPTVVDWRISAQKDGMPLEGFVLRRGHDNIMEITRRIGPPSKNNQNPVMFCEDLEMEILSENDVDGLVQFDQCPEPDQETEDPVATSTSSETSFVMEKSPLDFSNEDPPPMITNKGETEDQAPVVVSQEVSSAENIATA
ncbi:hypothetical protein Tco_1392335 [Tanacetum coccineum]